MLKDQTGHEQEEHTLQPRTDLSQFRHPTRFSKLLSLDNSDHFRDFNQAVYLSDSGESDYFAQISILVGQIQG